MVVMVKIIWPYDVIQIHFWWKSGQGPIKGVKFCVWYPCLKRTCLSLRISLGLRICHIFLVYDEQNIQESDNGPYQRRNAFLHYLFLHFCISALLHEKALRFPRYHGYVQWESILLNLYNRCVCAHHHLIAPGPITLMRPWSKPIQKRVIYKY